MGLYLRQLQLGPMDNFVYLVGDQGAPETAIIDAAWDVSAALAAAEADGREVTHALVSHHHLDHTNGLLPLLERRRGVQIRVHQADLPLLVPELQQRVKPLTAGELIEIGPLRLRALHTPGHTPGSTCFHLEPDQDDPGALFAGDTLFVNACGRCDLAGGDAALMFESLVRLSRLGENVRLYPGHDYGDVPVSSIGRERAQNIYFAKLGSLSDFVAYRNRPRA